MRLTVWERDMLLALCKERLKRVQLMAVEWPITDFSQEFEVLESTMAKLKEADVTR